MVEGVVSKGVYGFESSTGRPVVSKAQLSLELFKSDMIVDFSLEEVSDLLLEGGKQLFVAANVV